jgi:hypothetical protein
MRLLLLTAVLCATFLWRPADDRPKLCVMLVLSVALTWTADNNLSAAVWGAATYLIAEPLWAEVRKWWRERRRAS